MRSAIAQMTRIHRGYSQFQPQSLTVLQQAANAAANAGTLPESAEEFAALPTSLATPQTEPLAADDYRQAAQPAPSDPSATPYMRSTPTLAPTPSRTQHLRRIGIFEKIDGEYVGHIVTLHFKCQAIIKDNPYKKFAGEPDYIVTHTDAEVFHPDLGYAWDKNTDGTSTPYILVHLDDPSFPKTIVAVLVKGYKNIYHLYWDRVTITDGDIEKQVITEELIPYTGVFRPIDKVTEYLISIYPSLQEIWDPD